MTDISHLTLGAQIVESIYKAREDAAEDWRRDHLGASIIGHSCQRAVWYGFRWATNPELSGRILRMFNRGHREEEVVIEDLRRVGMTVEAVDPDSETGQYAFVDDATGGHFRGSCDGIVTGVPGAPKQPHLLEIKTANAKSFGRLVAEGVHRAQPRHVAQMQVYMHKMDLPRALYVAVCKDDDRMHIEVLKADPAAGKHYSDLAQFIARAEAPPPGISRDPSWWECRFCDHQAHCNGRKSETIEQNCRTCRHADCRMDGTWVCRNHGVELDPESQRRGCNDWSVIPEMVAQD